jgi:predicted amidophosphoribosyltransferase
MKYDPKQIEAATLSRWFGHDYYILSYPPVSRGRTVVTDFVLDFKANQEEAVALATRIILAHINKIQARLQEALCEYAVSIPPHTAGSINVPCEGACLAVTKRFKWITHLPMALWRTKSVQKASYASRGQRPTYDDHRASIEYRGPIRSNAASFIMLDDVFTKGNVSRACRDILMEEANCKRVIGIFLGRTV